MRAAAESDDLKDFKIVDVNMGCPVPKVYKNCEGSALLGDVNAAEKIVKECVKSGKIITVKIRTGLKYGDDVAAEYAKMAENAGASLVTVHGRVREAYYSGEPDFAAIERAVRAVKIPVIANGGIFTVADAEEMAAKTGAAGVMLARGALCNPILFSRLLSQKPFAALKEFIAEQLRLSALQKGEIRAVKEFRKFAPYYFKGVKDAKEVKKAISVAERAEEVLSALNEIL